MTKNKNNQAIWNTRIKSNTSSIFQKVGSSIGVDKRLYKEDIAGSIAHVEMLFKQKIISFKIKNKIVYGLNKIEKEISNKKFEFNKKYEDIHMNIFIFIIKFKFFIRYFFLNFIKTVNYFIFNFERDNFLLKQHLYMSNRSNYVLFIKSFVNIYRTSNFKKN